MSTRSTERINELFMLAVAEEPSSRVSVDQAVRRGLWARRRRRATGSLAVLAAVASASAVLPTVLALPAGTAFDGGRHGAGVVAAEGGPSHDGRSTDGGTPLKGTTVALSVRSGEGVDVGTALPLPDDAAAAVVDAVTERWTEWGLDRTPRSSVTGRLFASGARDVKPSPEAWLELPLAEGGILHTQVVEVEGCTVPVGGQDLCDVVTTVPADGDEESTDVGAYRHLLPDGRTAILVIATYGPATDVLGRADALENYNVPIWTALRKAGMGVVRAGS